MIKAVLFDMDGVIVDSEPFTQKILYNFFKTYDMVIPYDRLKYFVGSFGQDDIWNKVLDGKKPPYSIGYMNRALDGYIKKYPIPYDEYLMDNAFLTLSELKRKGLRLVIASNSCRSKVERMISLCRLEGIFDGIISEELVEKRKPDPDIYLKAIETAGFNKEECIAVEDSTYGILAAKNAGLKVIAKKDDRYGFIQDSADYSIKDLYEIIDILDNSPEAGN